LYALIIEHLGYGHQFSAVVFKL